MIGDGPDTILFLHGLGGDRTSWDRQHGAFGTRYRTVSWDMPGYGESAALPDLTFDTLADAVLRLMDAIGAAQVHLVGHSMGGMIAQRVAARAAERLLSLTLFATTARFGGDESWQERFLAQRLRPLDEGRTPADLAPLVVQDLIGDAADADGVAAAIASMSRISAPAYRAALQCLVTFDGRQTLANIDAPTFVLAAENDRTAPVKAMRRLANAIVDSRFVVLLGAGHLANLERPDVFNRILADFLAEIG